MSRVITFSRVYPPYHPKRGQPTRFIEKFYAGLADIQPDFKIPNDANKFWDWYEYYNCVLPKFHTFRVGHRWKEGDWFSPRVWGDDVNPKTGRSGPYHSKQIILCPDVQIKKTWDFDVHGTDFYLSGKHEVVGEGFDFSQVEKNDGLPAGDLFDWICDEPKFKKKQEVFGQIVCWNGKINY